MSKLIANDVSIVNIGKILYVALLETSIEFIFEGGKSVNQVFASSELAVAAFNNIKTHLGLAESCQK